MKNENNYGARHQKKHQDHTTLLDIELEQLAIAIERISLKRKESERKIREEKEALKDQQRLLDLYTARASRIIKEKDRDTVTNHLTLYGGGNRPDKKTTHYYIADFDKDEKRELFVGDQVFTNNGSGKFKGLREATVISSLPKGRVKLKFSGVDQHTVRLVSNLRHAVPKEE